jgi:hypothetical protein
MVTKLKVLMMVFTLFMIVQITYINNTTYLRLEITLMNYYMRLDKIEGTNIDFSKNFTNIIS